MIYWNNYKGSKTHSSTVKICRETGGKTGASTSPTDKYTIINQGITASGCPGTLLANKPFITRVIDLGRDSAVSIFVHTIRLYSGRADAYIRVDDKQVDWTLSYTPSRQWDDMIL